MWLVANVGRLLNEWWPFDSLETSSKSSSLHVSCIPIGWTRIVLEGEKGNEQILSILTGCASW